MWKFHTQKNNRINKKSNTVNPKTRNAFKQYFIVKGEIQNINLVNPVNINNKLTTEKGGKTEIGRLGDLEPNVIDNKEKDQTKTKLTQTQVPMDTAETNQLNDSNQTSYKQSLIREKKI